MEFYRGQTDLTPRELSVRVHHLPPGSMVWRETGGPAAWTDQMQLLSQVEYWTRVSDWRQTQNGRNGTNPPKALEPPRPAHERLAEESRIERRIRRHQERVTERARQQQENN